MKKHHITLGLLICILSTYVTQASVDANLWFPSTNPEHFRNTFDGDTKNSLDIAAIMNNEKPLTQIEKEVAIDYAIIFNGDIDFQDVFKVYMIEKFGNHLEKSRFYEKNLKILMSDIEFRYAYQTNLEILKLSQSDEQCTVNAFQLYFEMLLFQLFVPNFLDNIAHIEYSNKNISLAPRILLSRFSRYYRHHQDDQQKLAEKFYPLLKKIDQVSFDILSNMTEKNKTSEYLQIYQTQNFQDLLHHMATSTYAPTVQAN